MLNSKAKGKTTAGELVNLMSVDAQRLMELTTYINSLWSSPLQIGIALYFLYNTLGISILAGLGVLVLIIPLNILFGSRIGALQVTKFTRFLEATHLFESSDFIHFQYIHAPQIIIVLRSEIEIGWEKLNILVWNFPMVIFYFTFRLSEEFKNIFLYKAN